MNNVNVRKVSVGIMVILLVLTSFGILSAQDTSAVADTTVGWLENINSLISGRGKKAAGGILMAIGIIIGVVQLLKKGSGANVSWIQIMTIVLAEVIGGALLLS